MKISREWLSDFIEWNESNPEIIADQFTRCVGEVEAVEEQGALLEHCVVGRVQGIEKHPNADKLSVCTVQTDMGTKTVVCGGTNVRKDMLVAFAHIGATVQWHGTERVTLERISIRGVGSEGMICAQEELGLTAFPPVPADGPRPIADLSSLNAKVGTPLKKALHLTDVVFHIDNHAITNRPDLFSHIGVARELVALGLATWKKVPARKKLQFGKNPLPFRCTNDIPTLIPRYCGCVLSVEGIGQTPAWMKRRLEAVGSRSISLPVDITNYVMLECGTPIHSFDADHITGTVHMRTSKQGEQITTLDNVERTLPAGAAIMSDDTSVFDLLGIMGGLRGSTTDSTRTIYLHSAVIDPVTIRRAIIGLGHRTDAATLSEKGVPPIAAENGFFRALELFLDLAPGAKITSKMESSGKNGTRKAIPLTLDSLQATIGTAIKRATVKTILSDLGCKVAVAGKKLTVTPPLWRNDIVIRQDIIEEVARVYGYANVQAEMPEASIHPPVRDARFHIVRDALKDAGFFEMIHLSFTSPELLSKLGVGTKAEKIENPIGEEISVLRPSLLPALLGTAERELRTFEGSHLKLYEIGHAFQKGREWNELTAIIACREESALKSDPLLLLKRDIERVLAKAGHAVTFRPSETAHDLGHPGRSAEVTCDGKRVGLLFEIHPKLREVAGLQHRASACVIELGLLALQTSKTTVLSALPTFPAITLDETFPLSSRPHFDLIASIKKIDPLIEGVDIVDLYEGDGAKTATIRCTYRATDRTLRQEEVEKIHARVLAAIKSS